jgi:hypothetical protein
MGRGDGSDEIIQDSVGDGLGERAGISERVKIKFQGFTFHALLFRGVANGDRGKVRLTCDRAERGEFWSRKSDLEWATRFWIGKGFQSGKGRVRWHGDFAPEKR